jgi:hypothetical protein
MKANYLVMRNGNLVARCVLISDAIEFCNFVATSRGGDVRVENVRGLTLHFGIPSLAEPPRHFSDGHVRKMSELEFTHDVGVGAPPGASVLHSRTEATP